MPGRQPIQDKFAKLDVSRQRKYQLRRQAEGLCVMCGRRKLVTRTLCATCARKRGVKVPGKLQR